MLDLKVINSVLAQLEEERGIPKEKAIEAIEYALATAYKKEYGKKGQIVRGMFNMQTGETTFHQVKLVVDEAHVRMDEDVDDEHAEAVQTRVTDEKNKAEEGLDERVRFNPEHHIFLEDAKKIKKDTQVGDELIFPLETHEDFGRIAAQTAKQMIMQKIREAEKSYLSEEFGKREGEIITGSVQRIERGNIFVDLGRATGILPFEEQIQGERYRQGERIRAYLYEVEETPRGIFLRLSRSHPSFLFKLFEAESPEVANSVVEIKAIAREAGSRSKIAVYSTDEHIDPVGSLVGQRGVRVSTVMSELGGEKVDVVEWSEEPIHFIEDALSPAKVLDVTIVDEDTHRARVTVSEDQQSLAIGRGGQNVRLAAKLTGWKIDIQPAGGNVRDTEDEDKEEIESSGDDNSSAQNEEENETTAEKNTGSEVENVIESEDKEAETELSKVAEEEKDEKESK